MSKRPSGGYLPEGLVSSSSEEAVSCPVILSDLNLFLSSNLFFDRLLRLVHFR
jgi:hypothetical protein